MIVVPTLHPAAILRGEGEDKGLVRFRLTVSGDVHRAIEYLRRKPQWDEAVIWERDEHGRLKNLFPTLEEVRQFCVGAWRGEIYADIETTGEEPLNCKILCIGMCDQNGRAICVPFLKKGGAPYWKPEEEKQVVSWIGWLFKDIETLKVAHNGVNFDGVVLTPFGMPILGPVDDTMQMSHVQDGEMPHKLAFVGSTRTEVPYYKDDVKGKAAWIDIDEVDLRSYNLRDCLTTRAIRKPLLDKLRELGLGGLYHEEMQVCRIMARASLRGITVDRKKRDENFQFYRTAADKALGSLCAIAENPEFNPRSHPQLVEVLFDRLKFPVVRRSKKTEGPSTDKNAMVLLAIHAERPEQVQFLVNLISYRKNDKMATWIDSMPILPDGRVHAQWNHLPVTGRLSSSPNMQNWNKKIKSMFMAGPGMRIVSVDLSQAELRAEAYFAFDQEFLRMYRLGVNAHTANTTLLFGVRCANPNDTNPATEEYLREACRKYRSCELESLPLAVSKDKWKQFRTLAKIAIFTWFYGGLPQTQLQQLGSKRDPDTDELLFPKLTLRDMESFNAMAALLHPDIVAYQDRLVAQVKGQGYYRCPLSGRMIWFRAGFGRNKILDYPNQMLVASRVNKGMIAIDEKLRRYCPGAVIVQQVHDCLNVETPEEHIKTVGEILYEEFQRPFALPGFEQALLPAEPATNGIYFHEV